MLYFFIFRLAILHSRWIMKFIGNLKISFFFNIFWALCVGKALHGNNATIRADDHQYILRL